MFLTYGLLISSTDFIISDLTTVAGNSGLESIRGTRTPASAHRSCRWPKLPRRIASVWPMQSRRGHRLRANAQLRKCTGLCCVCRASVCQPRPNVCGDDTLQILLLCISTVSGTGNPDQMLMWIFQIHYIDVYFMKIVSDMGNPNQRLI